MSALYVCTPSDFPSPFDDNEKGPCENGCGTEIQWRPHAPKGIKKVCMPCAQLKADESSANGEITIGLTRQTWEEVQELMVSNETKH